MPPTSNVTERRPDWAEHLVRFLDDGIKLPGTNYRFGFDALLGLLPGVGDASTAVGSLTLFWLAIKRDVPRPVLIRMAINVAVDSLVGAVPVLGDVFDLFFKSNRRNLNLIREASGEGPVRRSRVGDYLTIAGIALLIGCAFALPILVVAFVIEALKG